MGQHWHDSILEILLKQTRNKLKKNDILAAQRHLKTTSQSDFEFSERLAETLVILEQEGYLLLPAPWLKQKKRFDIPDWISLIRREEDEQKRTDKCQQDQLRNQTAWEPRQMISIGPSLHKRQDLECAVKVNNYLLQRSGNPVCIPHREPALQIFGNEKALDKAIHKGLFHGRITLKDMDCFYCPEPLPFRPFSLKKEETSATRYWLWKIPTPIGAAAKPMKSFTAMPPSSMAKDSESLLPNRQAMDWKKL